MKKTLQKILAIALVGLTVLMVVLFLPKQKIDTQDQVSNLVPDQEESFDERTRNAQGRREHFFRLTRDPKTNKIPDNIRSKELEFAHKLNDSQKFKSSQIAEEINIVEAGPNDVGGRTRGLGIDSRNSDIILAGGAAGGMWKSTDGGDSWTQTSDLGENLRVTSLIQDPDNLNTWYYSTGEFAGSSRARDGGGQVYGSGIYTSTDNGDSWAQIQATADNDVSFNSEFDYISRVEISPTTGTGFFASTPFGIYRSTSNFNRNSLVLGGENEHIYADVQIASNGTVIAIISGSPNGVTASNTPGVYVSTNDGVSWTGITPSGYPSNPGRGVIGSSKSSPNIFYVFVADNADNPNLYKFDITDLNNVVSEDRTDNIPNFGAPVGELLLQGGYNMVCEVHSSNPDIVLIGGTILFRSEDGFATKPDDDDGNGLTDASENFEYWIGGYAKVNKIVLYNNHHPDQHVIVFDPNNNNRVFSSHDGGVSVTEDITADSVSWTSLNNGYNVTQFYTVSLHPDAGDDRIIGGTQDNGSPYFKYNSTTGTSASEDASSGDGAYQYLGTNYLITSAQLGFLVQYKYNTLGEPINFSFIAPLAASNQLFIHPFVVNHTNEDIIFYPSGRDLFRNNMATTLARNTDNQDGINEGWSELSNLSTEAGSLISTLAISTTNPSDVLYYASYSPFDTPKIYRLLNASTATETSDLKILEFTSSNSTSVPPDGAYIHDIAISEDNGNEVIAVVSNYNTESVYYSSNGGNTWTGVGGNLEPANGNGPSVRTAAITKTSGGEKTYYVGTSVGLYATNTLNGENTEWKFQGASTTKNAIIEYLDYRPSDQTLAIATHGRGIFIGNASTSVSTEQSFVSNTPQVFSLEQNYPNPFNPSTSISYSIPAASNVTITVYDVNGRKVADLINNTSMSAGTHQVKFDATNLASGVYLYRIDANSVSQNRSFTQIKRMTLIK